LAVGFVTRGHAHGFAVLTRKTKGVLGVVRQQQGFDAYGALYLRDEPTYAAPGGSVLGIARVCRMWINQPSLFIEIDDVSYGRQTIEHRREVKPVSILSKALKEHL
jgi:hypothetical protein